MEEKIYCKNCGAEANGAFCTSCGAPIDQPAADEVIQPPIAEQPADEVPVVEPELPPVKDPGKVFGIISLILGILGLVVSVTCCCIAPYVGGPLAGIFAIAAIILGVIGGKKSAEAGCKNGMAKIGKILGILILVLIVLAVVAVIVFYVLYAVLGISIAGMEMSSTPYYY